MKTEIPFTLMLLAGFAVGWFLADLIQGMILLIVALTVLYGA